MNLIQFLGAVLSALLLAAPALMLKTHWRIVREFYATRAVFRGLVRNLLCQELGTVTVTYKIRGAGVSIDSTTGPTAAQAAELQVQKALVAFGAVGDTQALFTHNWGLDASAPEYYDPVICVWPTVADTYYTCLTFDQTNTNVVKINKAANYGPITVVVALLRNSSMGQ